VNTKVMVDELLELRRIAPLLPPPFESPSVWSAYAFRCRELLAQIDAQQQSEFDQGLDG
jgi:hypothetical protein